MPSKSTKVQTSAPPEKRKREEAAPTAAASVESVKKTRVAEDDDEPAATAAPAGGAEARKKTGAEKKREKKARERAEKDKERAIEAARPTQGVPSALAPLSVAGVPAAEGGEPLPKKARTTGGASAAAGGEAGEMDAENEGGEEVEEDEDKGHSEPAEPLPTKEEIEADKDLEKSEGAKLALLYARLYLQFNPHPSYTPRVNAKKSMKKDGPLPADPWAEQQQSFFKSDFTPTQAKFELTPAQYASRKKAANVGAAKKGDGVSAERWKFSKPRESWLIRWSFDPLRLPTKYFPLSLAYLSSVKAPAARIELREGAEEALKVSAIAPSEGESDESKEEGDELAESEPARRGAAMLRMLGKQ